MPRPNPGETKEAFVSRYMADAEARRSYPDEKQRSAVAYSLFGEKKNANMCPGCGREQELQAGQFVNTCVCGARITGEQTPPIESLDNLCRSCTHPLDPEHDAFGCNIAGCSCTVQGGAIKETRDVLPNAVDAQLAVRIWGVAAPEDRATWARDAGVVLPQSGLPAAFSDFAPDAQEKLLSLFSKMSTPAAAPGSDA